MRKLRAAGDKSHASGDQSDSQPAQRTDVLVQHESGDQREQHIAERSCRQNISEIGPGECGHVGGKKGQQKQNSDRDPGIEYREDDALQMIEGNAAGLLHPVREHGVSGRGEDRDSGQHKILAKGHWKFRRCVTFGSSFRSSAVCAARQIWASSRESNGPLL